MPGLAAPAALPSLHVPRLCPPACTSHILLSQRLTALAVMHIRHGVNHTENPWLAPHLRQSAQKLDH